MYHMDFNVPVMLMVSLARLCMFTVLLMMRRCSSSGNAPIVIESE